MKTVCLLIVLVPLSLSAQSNANAGLNSAAQRSLAVLSGRLQVQGLTAKVDVWRDRWGVAHVYAQNQHDLFFAQGVVAAQDRLFQMELWKRAGQGRLAEVLGPSALRRDANARALRYRGDMKAEYESYSTDTLAILSAFTDGINAYISTLSAPGGPGLPVEFQLAGFAPEAWHPEDCLNRMAAFSMTGNAFGELEYAQAVTEFGAAKAARIFDFDPAVPLDPATSLDLSGLSPDLLKGLVGSDRRIEFPAHAREGSNNWTIAGSLTASGKPMLANDPHRVIGLPSLRYMVHLVAPGWNVIGAGEPGLPGVALGHNEHIAWGFTIFGLDQQDLYVEELNPANSLEYKTESGWKEMETRREVFRVKGAQETTIDLKFTRHGPVLWEDGKRAVALRWVGSEAGTAGYLASLAIDRARNWEEFEAAVARWKVPSENLVYADTEGNIGEHSAGLAPIRKWTGLLPVPASGSGTESGYEWSGFVPSSELPHSFNPKDGYIATANHKMIPEQYPYNVGFEWTPAYRYQRIHSVLEKAKREQHKLTVPDMEALQNDVLSLPALEFQKLISSSALKGEPALGSFLSWDGRVTTGSPDAALYELWFWKISVGVADLFDEKGAAKAHGASFDLAPNVVLRILANPDKNLFGDDPITARDRLLAETLKAARQELGRLLGPDASGWSWGKLHTVRFRHALDQQPEAQTFDLGPLARPGDEYTVNATGTEGTSWGQASGASYREILDAGDWDRSVAVNTPGQSGQPGARHYGDLMPLWAAGQYFPLVYSRSAVESEITDKLTLEP